MTVKDLKEILEGCNDDAIVQIISWDSGLVEIQPNQVFNSDDGKQVRIDLDFEVEHRAHPK